MDQQETGSKELQTLGALLRDLRRSAGLSVRTLSEMTGLSLGQLSNLENDRIKTVNPAHLAVLADPLGVSIYTLYKAAGYRSPESLADLEPELIARLSELPAAALERLSDFVDRLVREHNLAGDLVTNVEESDET